MMKKLKICFLLVIATVMVVGCAKKEEAQNGASDTYSYEADKDLYLLENENLKFTLDPNTTYFQVEDKTDHSVWASNPTNGGEDPLADAQSKKYLQSTLLIEYCNDIGVNTIYNNFEYSIEKKIYSIEQGEDFIKVNYTIGDVAQSFLMPDALPESRMKIFRDKMDSSASKKIDSYYRKIDINKLRATDNKGELLAQYPDLEKESVYVLRENTQDYLKKKIEALLTDAGYTMKDYEEDNARYAGKEGKEKPYFNVSIIYRIEGNDLVVEVPFENMEWNDSFPLTKVKVLPYLGAGTKEDSGFVLVPEGNGGIINFNNAKAEQSAYYTEVYGWDYGMQRDAVIDESRAAFPVYGISKNGSSMLCILEDYGAISTIEADVSGRNHSYNYACATYTTLHSASLDVSAKTDKSVMVYEAKKPEGAIKQRYRFIETDSYAKMATSYREYLMAQHLELQKREDTSTPVNVTILGAVDEVKQRLGFPATVAVPLTTYAQASDMLKDLKATGYKNLSIKYSGWMNGGIKQSIPTKIKTVSTLGSKRKLKEFIENSKELNTPVYLEGKVEFAYDEGLLDGFSINKDVAKFSSKEPVKLYEFSPIYYGEDELKDCFYLLRPQLAVENINNLTEYAKKLSANIALSDVGYMVGADYSPKNLTTREEVISMQEKELSDISSKGTKVMVNAGNDYVLPYVDYITDMDLSGSNFQIIDEMVPFYSMAIHGLVNYTGDSVNLSGDYKRAVLKSIETGAGLSFSFMKESAFELQDSNYTYLFGVEYDKWKEEAYEIYSRYDSELGHCFNQYMTNHECLADGVFATSYEDGTKVYVNYNDISYQSNNITVPAQDYVVVRR